MAQTSKQVKNTKLTSSTVRGMHILYSFSNIFLPLCASLVGFNIHNVSNQPSKMFPPPPVCNIWIRVSACGRMVSPGYEIHPSYGWVLSLEPTDTLSVNVRAEMSSVPFRIVPSYHADESSYEQTVSNKTGNRRIWGLQNKSIQFVTFDGRCPCLLLFL